MLCLLVCDKLYFIIEHQYDVILIGIYGMYTSRFNQGHEHEWLNDDRHDKAKASSSGGDETGLEKPLGAVQMGLIYVNPVSLHT